MINGTKNYITFYSSQHCTVFLIVIQKYLILKVFNFWKYFCTQQSEEILWNTMKQTKFGFETAVSSLWWTIRIRQWGGFVVAAYILNSLENWFSHLELECGPGLFFSKSVEIFSELKTFEWDNLNPDQLINLEINNKRRTSII